ncbi:MAG: EutN/CcmL family microcompartment protein [Candidatus Hodarchaeales archaeon]
MKLGKVIGNVVATVKDPGLEGLRFLVIQGLDDNFQPIGEPFVAADGIYTAGEGDIVYVVSKKEAAIAIHRDQVPIDECVVGFVEEYTVVEAAKKINDRAKRILEIKTEITKTAEIKRPPKVKAPPKKPIKTKRNLLRLRFLHLKKHLQRNLLRLRFLHLKKHLQRNLLRISALHLKKLLLRNLLELNVPHLRRPRRKSKTRIRRKI